MMMLFFILFPVIVLFEKPVDVAGFDPVKFVYAEKRNFSGVAELAHFLDGDAEGLGGLVESQRWNDGKPRFNAFGDAVADGEGEIDFVHDSASMV